MITLNNVGFAFGNRFLYRNVSFQIHAGDKIGLIGANGTGKSTLLRLIAGEYSCTEGEISTIKGLTIGFLNQDLLSYQSEKSILSVALEAYESAIQLQKEIDALIEQLETKYDENLAYQLSEKQAEFEHLGGYEMEHNAARVLSGLGFTTQDLQKPLYTFSGGWRMRVMLAKILLQKPHLLLLDEPTNHLDLPSIEWLEEYIRLYPGAMVIVSHDRNFLDRVVNKIAEVYQEKITLYNGNYTHFVEQKAERIAAQQAQYKNQQQRIKELERFIDRFRAKATKAAQVQSKIKMLEKMERVEKVEEDNPQIDFKFVVSTVSGKDVLRLENISKSYDQVKVLERSDAIVVRGDKVGLIGANGKGKSTLLRIIAGIEPFEGHRQVGHNVKISFFAQHQLESLNLNNDILTELEQHAPHLTTAYLRTVLGCFMFSGEDVFKPIKILSGGEKSRVALAKTLTSGANFLLLDEPTNHLDMASINALIQALEQYEGTYIVISHDRYFLSQVTNKIWYIENYQIKEYLGGYTEFEQWYKARQTNLNIVASQSNLQKVESKAKSSATQQQKIKSVSSQKRIAQIEAQIYEKESQICQIEQELANPDVYQDKERFELLTQRYQILKNEVEALMVEWESYIT
ncbi:MAG: ABC-F family ATP-binding cassette domain-containing protein [Bacteroidia bacterium]|nr:ABC-F family ATP-binding cassette domain-containing protein [Bacteroidia bacterium]